MAEITIKGVEGNPLNINVVMNEILHHLSDGVMETETVDFYPDTTKPVRAYLDSVTARRQYCPSVAVSGNTVYLSANNVTAGVYTLTIICTDTNGKTRRFKSDACIEIYDITRAAEVAEEFDSEQYTINGVFYTFMTQSDWDEVNPASPAYILNKPDLTEYATKEDIETIEGEIPVIPEWAQQPQKPTYTAGEVGAVPTSRTVNGKALSEDITLNAQDVGAQTPIADLAQIREGAAKGATAYQKPSNGMPKTDLAVSVQQSLDKADTAYQKPSAGIPKTDFAQEIQDRLNIPIDEIPTAGSNNLVKSGGVQNELALGVVYDVSAKNPTAGPNNDGKWESLSALLSDANLNTLIPTSVRKGGMSIKFVQSSDNKYVQFRCKTQSFSADPEDWAVCDDEVLVENPEYIKAECDKNGRLLFWIKKDASVDWAVGVPEPVKSYVDAFIVEILNGNEGTDIDGLNKVITFLDDFSTSDTLAALLNTKVDKQEGKGLIQNEVAASLSFEENPEYMDAEVDKEYKLISARKKDGTKIENVGIEVYGTEISCINDPEDRMSVILDKDDKIVLYRDKKGVLHENEIITSNLNLTDKGIEKFHDDLTDRHYVLQNLPQIARFEIDDVFKDFSEDIPGLPNDGSLLIALYEKMDALVEVYPDIITKVDAFEYVESQMNSLGVSDYPFYANGISEASTESITFPDGTSTTFTYDITPAYKTYMYIIDLSNWRWGNNSVHKHKDVLLIGGTHGQERQSQMNLYLFAKELCSGTTADKNYFAFRNSCRFFIVPMLSGYSVYHRLRSNANGVNINRNFLSSNGFKVSYTNQFDHGRPINYSGPSAYSEFETKLVKCLTEKINPAVVIDHHNYGLEIGAQIYYGTIVDEVMARCFYQAAVDISHALQKNYPENYGNKGRIFIEDTATLYNGSPVNEQSISSWCYNIANIRFASTVEVSANLNYIEGGIYVKDYQTDHPDYQPPDYTSVEYRSKVCAVSEYTLKVSLIRMLERMFTIKN